MQTQIVRELIPVNILNMSNLREGTIQHKSLTRLMLLSTFEMLCNEIFLGAVSELTEGDRRGGRLFRDPTTHSILKLV